MSTLSRITNYKYLNTFVLAVSFMTVAACSSSDDDNSSSTSVAAQAFDGTWDRDCTIENNGASSFIDTVIIDGDVSTRIRDTHSDSGCQQLSSRSSYDVTVTYGESSVLPNSGLTAQTIDMVIGEVRFIPLTEAAVTAFNESSLCGVNTYVLATASVVPLECEILDFGTGNLHSIWAVDDDLLYFGNNPTDGLTPEDRPTTLDINAPFRLRGN